MATTQSSDANVDDDYIDMEVSSSSSNFICCSISSPPKTREFEFQMSSVSADNKETSTTSPADELFYKGKLLPLQFPFRLQMVQKLLQNPTNTEEMLEENYGIPFISSSNTNTPLESCNISPSESCRVSCELNPDDCFFEWSTELNCFIRDRQKKSWAKKIKKSLLGLKIKASSSYLKSLFGKSGCIDESCAKAASNAEAETASKGKDFLGKYVKITKKKPIGKSDHSNERSRFQATLMKSMEKEMGDESSSIQRRSFSGAIQWHSATKSLSSSSTSSSGSSSSSSFSFSSNGFHDLQLLKRSSSANSEIESSIEGAIAHCKQSQLLFRSRKNSTEVGVPCSLSASEIAAFRDQERTKLCSF